MRGFVYLIVFFSFFDLFSQLPVMSPFALSLGATPFLVGLAVGMYSFSNTIGNIISGFMTDRKRSIPDSCTWTFRIGAVSLPLFICVWTDVLLGVRFVHGFHGRTDCPRSIHFSCKPCRRIETWKKCCNFRCICWIGRNYWSRVWRNCCC